MAIDNYIDKITKDGESRMISPAADKVRVENEHYEGDNLDDVLDEIDEKVSQGGEADSAMSSTSERPVQNKVIKAYVDNLIAGLIDGAPAALDTLKELATALGNNSDDIATIINTLSLKANASEVVKSISVNGQNPQTPTNGNVNIQMSGGQKGDKGDKGDTVVLNPQGLPQFNVVNDLTTGGASDAFSAEMGKRVAGREATDRQRIDAIVAILKKAVFTDDESTAIVALDALANATDSVSLDKSSYGFVGVSGTLELTVITDPAGKSVTWSSSNPSVATVSNGIVTPVAEGSTTISATTADGKTATCVVTVQAFVVNSVTISGDDLTNGVLTSNGETYGATHQLSAVTDPTGGNISWESSNESVATVNNGLVTIVGNGTATITASSGGKSDNITVNVSNISINSLTLDKQSLSFTDADETETIVATTNPANVPVTWSSSDTSVATVNNGVVTSVGNGQCTITATCFDKTATCSVNVQALPAGFQKNKAWNKIASTGGEAGITFYDGEPIASEGYCITRFYDILSSQNEGGIVYSKYGIKVKAGFTADHEVDGTHVDGDVEDGCVAFKNSSETHIVSRVIQSADPIFLTNSTNASRKVSATFKISELDNCYIYDFVKAARQGTQAGYLFAGSNIDTSVAPTKNDNADNNTLN